MSRAKCGRTHSSGIVTFLKTAFPSHAMSPARLLLLALFISTARAAEPGATPASEITAPPGFKVELLRSAAKNEGSWVSMAIDTKGRLYISPQDAIPESGFKRESKWGGLWRATLDTAGHITAWDKVPVPVGGAMGMLWAFDSLYVSGQGPDGQAIYRLRDTDADDTLDTATLFKRIPGGGGEHGAHALTLSPDGQSIYITNGNATPLIDGISPDSPYRNYAEDILIPRVMDPVATFFDKIKIPCGHILRTDENGTRWDLIAGGLRNAYDLDFNADGELFTYDSDMEWDVALPWYRPTRILHIVPGGEYGFREGNQKWPETYADSLPAAVNIGLGCPTGAKFGTRSTFPATYKSAFFVMDWTYGRLLAIHLHEKGASYTASNPLASYTSPRGPEASQDVEVFLTGKGMPLTDMEFGKDGAMYLTVGGRGTQGGLYRVSWGGGEVVKADIVEPDPVDGVSEVRMARVGRQIEHELEEARAYRHALETGLTFANQAADKIRAAETGDRFTYFAARTLAEKLPPDDLRKLALEPAHVADAGTIDGPNVPLVKNAQRVRALDSLQGLLALARVGGKETQADILESLKKFPIDSLSEDLQLLKLRVLKVSFARQGRPSPELVQMATEKLLAHYPASTFSLNRELSELLVWLTGGENDLSPAKTGASLAKTEPSGVNAHGLFFAKARGEIIARTLDLIDQAPTQEEQIWYACMLREAQGWTPAQRDRYFAWFSKAGGYFGGNSLKKYIERIRDQGLAHLPAEARPALLALATAPAPALQPAAPAIVRTFQKAYTMADLDPDLPRLPTGRNLARGREIFASAQCLACHHFGQQGGNVGPDLSAVGSRFQLRDILEAIVDPSKVISDQYATVTFTMKGGDSYVGQIASENNYSYDAIVNPVTGEHKLIVKTALEKKEVSKTSLMPPGLINTLTPDEILDLLAYLQAGPAAAK